MGNTSRFKRVLAIVLAATCMLVFSFSASFAASSPTSSKQPVTAKNKTTDTEKVGQYNTKKTGTCTLNQIKKSKRAKLKTKVIYDKVKIKGVKYKVVGVNSKAFKGCKKLKTIKIKSKTLTKFSKNAFKGLKKSQIKKIKVKVNKKMSKKNYKKLVKALTKAGIKKKNIKKVKM